MSACSRLSALSVPALPSRAVGNTNFWRRCSTKSRRTLQSLYPLIVRLHTEENSMFLFHVILWRKVNKSLIVMDKVASLRFSLNSRASKSPGLIPPAWSLVPTNTTPTGQSGRLQLNTTRRVDTQPTACVSGRCSRSRGSNYMECSDYRRRRT